MWLTHPLQFILYNEILSCSSEIVKCHLKLHFSVSIQEVTCIWNKTILPRWMLLQTGFFFLLPYFIFLHKSTYFILKHTHSSSYTIPHELSASLWDVTALQISFNNNIHNHSLNTNKWGNMTLSRVLTLRTEKYAYIQSMNTKNWGNTTISRFLTLRPEEIWLYPKY